MSTLDVRRPAPSEECRRATLVSRPWPRQAAPAVESRSAPCSMMRKKELEAAFPAVRPRSVSDKQTATKVPNPPTRPLLVFDGDCGFCRTWVTRWRRVVGERIAYEPFQAVSARFPNIPRARFRRAIQLIMPDGEVFEGAEAVFRTLAMASDRPRHRRWLEVYQRVPGARPVFEWGYLWVAEHRPVLGRISHFLFGPPHDDSAEPDPELAQELAAARRRRFTLGAGLGAALLLGGLAAWRRFKGRSSGSG
jgi:predicted DCC family thiol-disulfide oxidoreductase YuxK